MRRSRSFAVIVMIALGVLGAPQVASALKFTPAAGSPLTLGGDQVNMSATGDFNGDGRDDIAAVKNANEFHVWLSQADGTFTTPAGSPFGENSLLGTRRTIIAGDFNGDDDIDLASGYSGAFEVHFGEGDGTFGENADEFFTVPPTAPNSRTTAEDDANTLGDVDEDGDIDIVFGMLETGYAVMLNDGDGDFAIAPGGLGYFFPLAERPQFTRSQSPALGDWNGDGDIDLAVALGNFNDLSMPIGIYVAEGNGDGTFTPDGQAPLPAINYSTLVTINLNDDAYDDLALANFTDGTTDNIFTFPGGAGGLTANPNPDGSVSVPWPWRIAAVDLDDRQRADLAIASIFPGATLRGLGNPGDGTLVPIAGSPFEIPQIGGDNAAPKRVYSGDFNSDGAPDLATDSPYQNSGQAKGVTILLNRPDAAGPAGVDFGEVVPPGTTNESIKIENTGAAPAISSSGIQITGADSDQFSLGATSCGGQLNGNGDCTQVVSFTPTTLGPKQANLVWEMSNQDDVIVPLSGISGVPELTVPSAVHHYAGTLTGNTRTQTFTLESTGSAAVAIGTPAVASNPSTGSGAFTITDDTCAGETLAVDATCEVEVTFAPPTIGLKSTSIQVPSSDPAGGGTRSFGIDGQGIDPAITVSPATHEFGDVDLEDASAVRPVKTFTVTSSGTTGVTVSDFEIEGIDDGDFEFVSPPSCGVLAPASTCQVQVRFNPKGGEPRVRAADLIIEGSARGGDKTVALTGRTVTGGPPDPPPGSPKLALSLKSPGKVKAGKTLTVKATVRNTGDAAAGLIVLKAALPKKFGKAPKAIKAGALPAGGSVTRKIKIRVKKSAKKGKRFAVTVTATGVGAKKVSAKRTAKIG